MPSMQSFTGYRLLARSRGYTAIVVAVQSSSPAPGPTVRPYQAGEVVIGGLSQDLAHVPSERPGQAEAS